MFLFCLFFTGTAWQMAIQNDGKILCKPIPLFFPLTHGKTTLWETQGNSTWEIPPKAHPHGKSMYLKYKDRTSGETEVTLPMPVPNRERGTRGDGRGRPRHLLVMRTTSELPVTTRLVVEQ